MRNRALHDALRDFALEAAALLMEEVRGGAQLAFVVEEQGTYPVLYRYCPLTAEFIAVRWAALHALPAYAPAAHAMAPRAGVYLRMRGLRGDGPEPVLRDILERLYDEATSFEFPEERFESLYADIERALSESLLTATVVSPVHGVRIESDRVELDDGGLALAAPDAADAPPEALDPPAEAIEAGAAEPDHAGAGPAVLCTYEAELTPDEPLPLWHAHARFRAVLTALRLEGARAAALGPLAWGRTGQGAWRAAPLASSARASADLWDLRRADEAELRALVGVVTGFRHDGAVAWALKRFELGCDRELDTDALSDYLLALRALLADDDRGAGVPLRLAALCVGADERQAAQRRVELAYALERRVVAGGGDYADAIGSESPRAIVDDVERHLRALLRDVLCGYLDPDLRSAADEILLAAGDRHEIRAGDLRAAPARRAPVEPASPIDADTEEFEAIGEAAVTPSADWGFDEDAESYSAPV